MPRLGWRLLHLLAMASLAITQPLLGILGDNPTFFTAHDSTPGQIVGLALVVAIVPAAVAGTAASTAHFFRPLLGARIHIGLMAAFTFLAVVQIIDALPGPWILPVILAAAITFGLVLVYLRQEAARSIVSTLALTPAVFVGLFLFVSPTSDVVFPDDVDAVDLGDLLIDDGFGIGDEVSDPDGDSPAAVLSLAERVNDRFPSIFLLVFDELPMASLLDETGEVDAVRWPNFARLAETSHLFSNATTVGFTTERAIPAILTARYETRAAPVYSLYPENLFTLLGDIYDVSSEDPLVDLCPPSVCNGAPPQSMIDLLATDDAEAPGTTTPSSTTTSLAPPPAQDEQDDAGSFSLLLDDAWIVFGHLATPDGLEVGLPSIGSTWGNFGGDQGADGHNDEFAPTPSTSTSTSTSTTTTAPPLTVDVGQVPIDDVVAVDTDAVNEENTEFLDSLITDDSRVADFRAEVAAITASDTPQLHYLHTLLPHVPWRLHGNGDTYADIGLPGYFSMWDDDLTTARAGQQRHLLQLEFADRLLGEYLDQLESQGILDAATVIVLADHGISFMPGAPARGVRPENLGGIAGVPLFYKLPGQTEGERHHDPVETLDILPTIAAQLDIEVPWAIDGYDLLGPAVARDRAVRHPFSADIPDDYQRMMDAVTADLLGVFGNGTTGSLYALAGMRELIGESITELVDGSAGYCWVRDRPTAIPDDEGATGYVFGRLTTSRADRIPFAITVDDRLTGTAVTLDDGASHRVFAFGDPQYWVDAVVADVELHEIVDGRLRPIPVC